MDESGTLLELLSWGNGWENTYEQLYSLLSAALVMLLGWIFSASWLGTSGCCKMT